MTFTGYSLYLGTTTQANSVCDLNIAESHTCFIRGQYPITQGREKYKLLRGDYENCRKDDSVWSLSEMGERDFLDINNINHQRLITFDSKNDYRYRLQAGRVLDWSPSCQDIVPAMTEKPEEIKRVEKQYNTLFVLYIISLVFSCLSLFAMIFGTFILQRKIVKIAFFVRLCAWIMVVPSIVICFVQARRFYTYFT